MVNISRPSVPAGLEWLIFLAIAGLIVKLSPKTLLNVLKNTQADWMYYLGVILFFGGMVAFYFSMTTEEDTGLSLWAAAGILLGGLVFVLRPLPKAKK